MANKKRSNKMRTRKHQKGGAWYNPMSWGQSDDPTKPSVFSGWFDSGKSAVSGVVTGAEDVLGKGADAVSSGFSKVREDVSSGLETMKDKITGTKTGEQEQEQEQVPELTAEQKQEQMENLRLMQGDMQQDTQQDTQQDMQMQAEEIQQSAGRRRKSRKSRKSIKSKKSRKSKKSKKTKGGSKLGLTYYATPVQGLKVAQPSYWEVYGDGHIMAAGTKRKGRKKC